MIAQEKLKQYRGWISECSAYRMVLNTIGIDKQTVTPSAGMAYRDERSSYLAGELSSLETDLEIIVLPKGLEDDPAVDAEIKRAMRLYYKSVMDTMCIPKEEFVAYQKLYDESSDVWILVKSKADYSIFESYSRWVIESQKKLYGYREGDQSVYDQMLDDFEPGMTQEKYDAFLAVLKERLVPLIRKAMVAKQIREDFLHLEYPAEEQKKFMNELLTYLHFDPSWGYQNEPEHPLTSPICEDDCRTTTKYILNNVISAISSMVHEVGHMYYEYNVGPKYDGTVLLEGISSGMHELQSRLCENYLTRTEAFWCYHCPKLKTQFPKQLGDVSPEDFLEAVNAPKPSFICIGVDELTYLMHVPIRYGIEEGLFSGIIPTEGLDKTWNVKYEEYLGVDMPNVKVGILQDVHQSDGSSGYFPTYVLDTAFAAQLVHTMRKELDVGKLFENNQYDVVMGWLKEHIHKYGCRYDVPEFMKLVTSEDLGVNYFLDYIGEKYTELYQLQERYRSGSITE